MEKEIELIRMSSTEIMEKVAAYKDEQKMKPNNIPPYGLTFSWRSYV